MTDGIPSGRAVTGADGPSATHAFSSDQIAPRDRRAFWKEAIFDAIANVDLAFRDDDAFRGELRWRGYTLGERERVTFTSVAATPQSARRGAVQVGREKEAFIGVTFHNRGTAAVEQGGRGGMLQPGDIWLLDGTQRSFIDLREPFDQVLFRIPYERLAPLLPRGGHWRGQVLPRSSPFCAVLNAHVGALGAALEQLGPASRDALLENTINLIALAFTDEIKRFAGDDSTVRRALAMRAMTFIENRLADPRLSAAAVAAALGVSTGYLQHVFQAAGTTVGAHVRRRRLERCRDDLADPLRAREQIAEIAMRWGFGDMPHFSRAFRERFGLSPREYRAQAQTERGRESG